MSIEVHHHGHFEKIGRSKRYIGGKVDLLENFDTDKFGYLELRGKLKEFGIVPEFKMYERLHGKSIEMGLVPIENGKDWMTMASHLDPTFNVHLYIEHFENETLPKELLPDYCLADEDVLRSSDVGGHNVIEKVSYNFLADEDLAFDYDFWWEDDGKGAYDYEIEVTNKDKGKGKHDDESDYQANSEEDEEVITEHVGEVAGRQNCALQQQKKKKVKGKITFGDPEEDNDPEGENAIFDIANVGDVDASRGGRPSKVKEPEVVCGGEASPLEGVASAYSDSQSLRNLRVEEDNEEVQSMPQAREFREDRDLEKPILEAGMIFHNAVEFRKLIREHAIHHGANLAWEKNDGSMIIVKCNDSNCKFRAYGRLSRDESCFKMIRLTEEHTCSRTSQSLQVTSTWIANKYLDKFRDEPEWTAKSMRTTILRDFGIIVPLHTLYRARHLAHDEIQGKAWEQYSMLWDYAHCLLERNPGSHVYVKTKPSSVDPSVKEFWGFFATFPPMINGLLTGCRPIVGLDGCHLKTVIGGVLLSAVARDGNNQMFPVAYAVVTVENKETWVWFLESLITALGVNSLNGWTFLSDRQKVCELIPLI